jgi:hypothetical protein
VQRFLTELEEPLAVSAVNTPVLVDTNDRVGPDRRWDLSVSSGWRVGSEFLQGLEVGARWGHLLGASGRLVLAGGRGVTGENDLVAMRHGYLGRARARQFPVELAVGAQPGLAVELQAGLGAGLDVSWVRASADGGNAETHLLPGPTGSRRQACVCPCAAGHSSASPEGGRELGDLPVLVSSQIKVDDLTIFSVPTRRIYVRIAADVGFTLRDGKPKTRALIDQVTLGSPTEHHFARSVDAGHPGCRARDPLPARGPHRLAAAVRPARTSGVPVSSVRWGSPGTSAKTRSRTSSWRCPAALDSFRGEAMLSTWIYRIAARHAGRLGRRRRVRDVLRTLLLREPLPAPPERSSARPRCISSIAAVTPICKEADGPGVVSR